MSAVALVCARLAALIALAVAVALASGATRTVSAAGSKQPQAVPGELIVGFERQASRGNRDAALAQAGAKRKHDFAQIHATLVEVPAARSAAVTEALQHNPHVRYVEPNHVVTALAVPDDPSFGQLWGLHNTGQTGGTADADIDAPEAWDLSTGSSGVVVAVTDSGVDFGHADLAAQQWINAGENCGSTDPTIVCDQRANAVDDDANGYVDDWRGWDWANDDNNPFDDVSHGTHVAGTIGAVGNNGVGVAGVNWNVRIMSLKFLNFLGLGDTADAVSATLYAANKGARVSSNSWAGGPYSQALVDAIEYGASRSMLFVAAAGNDGVNNDATPLYPASYESDALVAVAATDHNDVIAGFSNYGAKSVDLGAPGANIYSTTPGNAYGSKSGTSMATPHVSGVAALIAARFPSATVYGTKALLLGSVDTNASLSGKTTTGGRLNAGNAASCADLPKVLLAAPGDGFTGAIGTPFQIRVVGANCADPAGVANVEVTVNGDAVTMSAATPDTALYTGSYTASVQGTLAVVARVTVGGASVTQTVTGTTVPQPSAPLPILDDFNRPDESPVSDAGRWSNGMNGGEVGLYVTSGTLACNRTTTCSAWRNNAQHGPDAESWARITTLPGAGNAIRLYVRVQTPGSTAVDGYMLRTSQLSGTDQVFLERLDDGVITTRLTVNQELAVGDTMLLRAQGARIEAWRHDGIAWLRIGVVTDTTYGAQGFVGVGLRGTTARLDDFGGRSMSLNPPFAPIGLSALAGDGTVHLSWQPPSFDGGSPITEYKVYRGLSPGGEVFSTSAGTATSFDDSGLTNGITYYYKVSAVNAVDEGPLSNEASATPAALVPPVEPLPILDDFNRPDENPVSDAGRWTNGMNGGEIGLFVTANTLACSRTTTCSAWRNDAQYGPDAESWARIGVLPGDGNAIRLYVRVQAPGSSAVDGYMLRTNQLSGADQVFLERLANGVITTRLTVNQDLAAGDTLLLRAVGSTIEAWRNDGIAWARLATVSDSTYSAAGFVGVGLRGTTARLDDFGGRTFGSTPPAEPPGAPSGLAAQGSNGVVDLTWQAPASDGGSPITGYNVYRGLSAGGEAFLTSVGVVTSYADTTVTNGTTYYYKVAAVNAVDEGPLSNEASATPISPPEPPGAPTGLTAQGLNTMVDLAWQAPASDGGSPITGYNVYRGLSAGGEAFLASVGVVTSYADTTVTNGITYYYKVAAVNVVDEGPHSNEASATPTDLFPPAEPLPVLDGFNRANEIPLSDGGRWTNGVAGGETGLYVVSSTLACSRTTTCTAWRNNAQYGPDAESWARITTLPGSGNGIRLYVRVQTPGSSAVDGYMLRTNQRSGTDQVFLERLDNGVITTRLTINQELTVGDTLLLRARGSTLEAWRRAGGVWTRLGLVTDSTYGAAGYAGVGLRAKKARLDDFGARTLSS